MERRDGTGWDLVAWLALSVGEATDDPEPFEEAVFGPFPTKELALAHGEKAHAGMAKRIEEVMDRLGVSGGPPTIVDMKKRVDA